MAAQGRRKAIALHRAVQLTGTDPGFQVRRPVLRIDADRVQGRQVDYQAIADGSSQNIVAT
jgi:hypothetical protein